MIQYCFNLPYAGHERLIFLGSEALYEVRAVLGFQVFFDCLTFEDGTDGLCRNISTDLTLYAA
jgi:hypothetical protein